MDQKTPGVQPVTPKVAATTEPFEETLKAVKSFIPRLQMIVLLGFTDGQEGPFFREKIREIVQTVRTMPQTYEQDGLEDQAVAHLHYFAGGMDWYITEKDMDGGIDQAFGYVVPHRNPDHAELGYISIREIAGIREAEIDLHFQPKTLADIKSELRKRNDAEITAEEDAADLAAPGLS